MMRQNTKTAVKKLKRLILDPKDNVEDFRSRLEAEFADGSKEKLWTTFSDHQIDINQYYNKEREIFLFCKAA